VSGLVSVVFVYKSSLNMVAPISNFAVVDHRAVIHFAWSQKIKISEMHRREHGKYGEQRGKRGSFATR
jgi:hypothetical protein